MDDYTYNHINDVMQDLYQDGKLGESEFEVICNIIDRADRYDKYRWHDLRKDPTDLPTHEGRVLAFECDMLEFDEDIWTDYITTSYRYVYNPFTNTMSDIKRWELPQYHKQKNVIAWCEIEPYEESAE